MAATTCDNMPLLITSLSHHQETNNDLRYDVVQRIVSPSPHQDHPETEIETVLEVGKEQGGGRMWRRVVVRSGPSCPKPVIHGSFKLPEDGSSDTLIQPDRSVICWTSFQPQPDHKLLCALANPSVLCIWDVYPRDGGEGDGLGAEGHSIQLPFEASSIYPAGDNGRGLLLQRMDSLEDRLLFDAQNKVWSMNTGLHNHMVDEEEDGFFLKPPPRPVRLGGSEIPSASSIGGGGNASVSASSLVPSLFSLSHPLDDVLPVSRISSERDEPPRIATDVFEKILFAGVVSWSELSVAGSKRREWKQPICVTYHTQRKRHAVWEIKVAPPPPPQVPLWQITNQWRSNHSWNSHLGVLNQDLDEMEYVTMPDRDSSHYAAPTRNDALADALGIRKTPRKGVEDSAPRTRGTANRSRHINKVANSSLFSPASRQGPGDTQFTDMDTSGDSIGRTSLLPSLGPFSTLHPSTAVRCLYEEDGSATQAFDVFLTSNRQGNGTLVLCLVCNAEGQSNPTEVKLLELTTRTPDAGTQNSSDLCETLENSLCVRPLDNIQCISAQPIQATAIPPCFVADVASFRRGWQDRATDILVLTNCDLIKRKRLFLYRANMKIVECAFESSEKRDLDVSAIHDIASSVHDRVDFNCVGDSMQKFKVRGCLSMFMASNILCERTLQAVESGILSSSNSDSILESIELSLKLRADAVRLEQALCGAECGTPLVQDTSCSALETTLFAIFFFDILGLNVNEDSLPSSHQRDSGSSSWEQLLESEFHIMSCTEDADFLFGGSPHSLRGAPSSLRFLWDKLKLIGSSAVACVGKHKKSFSPVIFDSLHMLYEEFKLSINSEPDSSLKFLGTILGRICCVRRMAPGPDNVQEICNLFLDQYRRTLGLDWFRRLEAETLFTKNVIMSANRRIEGSISTFISPPCFMSWVDCLIAGAEAASVYGRCGAASINDACTKTKALVRVLPILFDRQHYSSGASSSCEDHFYRTRDHKVVNALIEEGYVDPSVIRDEFPAGIALPLLEVLHRCRDDPSETGQSRLDSKAWSLIGREDLCRNVQCSKTLVADCVFTRHKPSSVTSTGQAEDRNTFEDVDKDGIVPLEFSSSMLFPNDNRIREVGRLLRSSRPTYLSVPRAIEVSDHDYERMKQDKLLLFSRRVLAVPVGRGMFTIGNLQPVPAEPLPVPDLCLVGRVPPTNAMLALDISDCPADLKVWPEFHNGVAAGLRLPLEEDASEVVSKITRTWIVYNRPPRNGQANNNGNGTNDPSDNVGHSHGGLLMALGLRGHLTTLEMTDIFDYLTQGSVTTTVGVLLGMASNMRGSCDTSVSKMLCLHIPSLIPQHFSTIDVASPVQAAAVAGAGLLYQGSSHRMMTEFLLNEIGKRPASDQNAFDREAYTLACGIALGMVNLCQGDRLGASESSGAAGLSDLKIEERLYRYVVGGLDDAERRRREDEDRLSLPSSAAAGSSEKCSCVFEGESINTDVTAPGAILALGLIYMKSGNKTIASALSLPDTHFLLEYVRPDFLMLRIIARSMILWGNVRPSRAWIEAQLPPVVQKACRQMRATARRATDFSDPADASHLGSGSDLKETADSFDNDNRAGNGKPGAASYSEHDQDYDRQAVRQIYAHVIAGACFSIGLRFAGTGDKAAAEAIFERVVELQDLRDVNNPISVALRPAGPVLEMCLGCAAISLSLVLAGTGDLKTLKLLRALRWRCDEDVNYGTHMTYGIAIGLLFLGGGTCTLGREPEDVAALVASFFPRFPSTTSDNQYHLQALRNLYALAVKPRELRAVDVDTGESVFVPVEIQFLNNSASPLNMTAPCLLGNTDEKPSRLRIVSDRYYPLSLRVDNPAVGRTFFVKKRSAHLSYVQDPEAHRSLLVQTGNFRGGPFLDLVASFTEDPKVVAFAQYLCATENQTPNQGSYNPFSVAGFCTRVLHECLSLDTEEALPLYLSLRCAVEASISHPHSIWDCRLIRSYYENRRNILSDSSPRLLNNEIVAYINELTERKLAEDRGTDVGEAGFSTYYNTPLGTKWTRDGETMDLSP